MTLVKIRLLVIDDNIEFCHLVRDYISMTDDFIFAGCAFDGVSGYEMICKKQPDVVLLDNIMPYLDGIGVLKKVMDSDIENKPKFVAITSCPTEVFMENAYDLGVDYAMSRKSDIDEMINRCRMVVKGNGKNETGSEKYKTADIESVVTDILCGFGIPANVKGFSFLRICVIDAVSDPTVVNGITKKMYPKVAKMYNTTIATVERNIRTALDIAWKRGNAEKFDEYFGISVKRSNKRPKTAEFIAMIADRIRIGKRGSHIS